MGFVYDGFCAGEPWNTVAIKSGFGFCLATSEELCEAHPEKVLLVTADFAEHRGEEHLRLIRALLDACQICDDEKHRPEIAKLLSRPEYLDLPEAMIRNSLCGQFDRGTGDHFPISGIHTFSGESVNRPTAEMANLVLSQLRGCGQLDADSMRGRPKPYQVFRDDLYTAATAKNSSKRAAIAV